MVASKGKKNRLIVGRSSRTIQAKFGGFVSGSFRQNEHTISHGPAIYPPSTQATGIGTPALELAQDFDFSNEAMDMDIDDGLELKKADEDVVALPGGIKSKLPRKKERNLNSVSI